MDNLVKNEVDFTDNSSNKIIIEKQFHFLLLKMVYQK